MTKFIWVRDANNTEHYVNVNHIVRVTKIPVRGSYIMLRDEKTIRLSTDTYDTADDVITKIQVASA
jgi:hypothetical protein